jgi:hypothetical protein
VKTKVTSFKLTKYDLATAYLDNLVLFFNDGDIFFHGATAPSGPGPPHCRGFTITLRHTALGRTSMPLSEFEVAIPASERPQTHAVDRAATGIGTVDRDSNVNNSHVRKRIYPWRGLRATCFSRGRKRI